MYVDNIFHTYKHTPMKHLLTALIITFTLTGCSEGVVGPDRSHQAERVPRDVVTTDPPTEPAEIDSVELCEVCDIPTIY